MTLNSVKVKNMKNKKSRKKTNLIYNPKLVETAELVTFIENRYGKQDLMFE